MCIYLCGNLCGKISACLGYFRVIIFCFGCPSPLDGITESFLRLYLCEVLWSFWEKNLLREKNVEPAIYFHLTWRWQCALVFPFLPAAACCCSLVPVYFKLTVSQISIFLRHVSFYRTRNWPCTALNLCGYLPWLHHAIYAHSCSLCM